MHGWRSKVSCGIKRSYEGRTYYKEDLEERVIHEDACEIIPDRGKSQFKDPETEKCFWIVLNVGYK